MEVCIVAVNFCISGENQEGGSDVCMVMLAAIASLNASSLQSKVDTLDSFELLVGFFSWFPGPQVLDIDIISPGAHLFHKSC